MDINHINDLLRKLKSVKKVREELGISEKRFQREVKDLGYRYNQKLKQYEPDIADDKSMTKVSKEYKITPEYIQQDIILNDDKGMTIDIQNDIKANIINLANDYDKIQQVIKWFDNRVDDKGMTEVIEVINQGIKINLPQSENIRTTIRINKEIWDKFEGFSKKNKEFNKQDLMAQALKEYMEKY